jgi:hypothetical protein
MIQLFARHRQHLTLGTDIDSTAAAMINYVMLVSRQGECSTWGCGCGCDCDCGAGRRGDETASSSTIADTRRLHLLNRYRVPQLSQYNYREHD